MRSDGRIATRNYLAVLSTVNCSATVARMIADRVQATSDVSGRSSFDGVVALTHGTGCGMGSTGEGIDLLRRTLAGFASHPNFGGVLLVGLGCEANQVADIVDIHGLADSDRFRTLNIQDVGGTSACVEAGSKIVESMMASATDVQRQPVPVSHLKLGLQCGGSDGYSGITANPALGAAADILVRHGGTAILSETPEIYGAEHLLTSRAATPEIARALLDRISWWEDYTARNHGTMDNNPSPGNKAGGLTTILEKSLGAVAKSGTSGLMGVYGYGEQIDTPGFVFMDSPGYDPVSVTGQVASGANIVCFTTGRGSAYGCVPAPSLKLSTTTALFERQRDDIDINCGAVLDSGVSVEEMGERIFAEILRVASGARTKSEALGYGHNEFAPWVVGAVM
ncbi:MAG: UxaA family hydrolase [Acidimicrobiales bacterium]